MSSTHNFLIRTEPPRLFRIFISESTHIFLFLPARYKPMHLKEHKPANVSQHPCRHQHDTTLCAGENTARADALSTTEEREGQKNWNGCGGAASAEPSRAEHSTWPAGGASRGFHPHTSAFCMAAQGGAERLCVQAGLL